MAHTFIFVSNAQDGDISGYRLDRTTATLHPVSRTNAAALVMPIAIHPQSAILYAAARRAPFALISYRINPSTGELTPLATTPVANSFVNLSFDRSGRWLLAPSYGANLLTVFSVDPQGRVHPEPASTLSGGKKPHACLPDAGSDLVFVPYLGDDLIQAYRFDATHGKFAPDPDYTLKVSSGSGPRHAQLSSNGCSLYVLNELTGTVTVYSRENVQARFVEQQCENSIPDDAGMVPGRARVPSGTAAAVDDALDVNSIYCADIQMRPDGRFLYTSERSRGLLSQFSVDPINGRIERIETIQTIASPRSFAIDTAGEFAVVAGQNDPRVALYAIDKHSGRLTLSSYVDGGNDANWVAMADFA